MKIHEIVVYQEFDAPAEVVWEAFSDHVNFGRLMGFTIERIVDSKDGGNINGVGSVRRIKVPVFGFEETVVKSEKAKCIEYKISQGTPLNHHYGKMLFKSLPGERSAMDYSITIGSKIPLIGAIVKSALGKGIAKGLKKYAKQLKK